MSETALLLIEKAEKEQKRWWGGDGKYENASEFYQRAAAKYKVNKDFEAAGECFIKAAEMFEKINSEIEAVTQWKEAGKAFKKDHPEKARECFERAINYYKDSNRFNQAGKLYEEIAKGYLEIEDKKRAIEAYIASSQCHSADDDLHSANKRLIEVAFHSAELHDYETAIKYYEKAARDNVDTQLGRWSVKNYLFAASLCQLCRSAISDTLQTAQDAHESYIQMSELYRNTREEKLITGLLEAMFEGNEEKFNNLVRQYDDISTLDRWKMERLLEARKYYKGDDFDFGKDQTTYEEKERTQGAYSKRDNDEPDFM